MKELVEWAISVLDSLGHDLETGAETKAQVARRCHQRAAELRARLSPPEGHGVPQCGDCGLNGCPHPEVCREERARYLRKYGALGESQLKT